MLDLLLDWDSALSYGSDVIAYLLMALVGTAFFVLRLLFALFFGGSGDFDVGLHDAATDASFSFFSLLSILAFFMGAGWMGLACRVDWDLASLTAAAAAATFGLAMMSLASALMAFTRRLGRTIEYDLASAIGRTGRVYLTVPEHGAGRGQVEVDVSGRRKIVEAVSSGARLTQFSSVRIEAVRDDGTLVVAPLD